jgi:hypothetical protein
MIASLPPRIFALPPPELLAVFVSVDYPRLMALVADMLHVVRVVQLWHTFAPVYQTVVPLGSRAHFAALA